MRSGDVCAHGSWYSYGQMKDLCRPKAFQIKDMQLIENDIGMKDLMKKEADMIISKNSN